MDKLKAAAQAVTGGAAKVTIAYEPQVAFPGDPIRVKVAATSAGGEVKSKGVFVDLQGQEEIRVPRSAVGAQTKGSQMSFGDIHTWKNTFEQAFQIAPEFVLGANETKQFEGVVQLPAALEPSYRGVYAQHKWEIRGRIEAFGNDPDSGWQPLRVGLKG
jgi:sporulation-control protein spo0M